MPSLDQFLDQLQHGIDVAKFKADQFMRVNRMQGEINDLRHEILGTHDKIVNTVEELHKKNASMPPELQQLCASIDQLETRIAEKEKQIADIHAEVPPQMPFQAQTSYARPDVPPPPEPTPVSSVVTPTPEIPPPGRPAEFAKPSEPYSNSVPVTDSSKCPNCESNVTADDIFCPTCGRPIPTTSS
jgi:hypothetical protein